LTGEVVRALLVFALLSLNFTSVAAAGDGAPEAASAKSISAAFSSFCGDLGNPAGSSDHAPCHACRLFDGIDLPAQALVTARLVRRASAVEHAWTSVPIPRPFALGKVPPRGPPLA
jgi:hypothetical protein